MKRKKKFMLLIVFLIALFGISTSVNAAVKMKETNVLVLKGKTYTLKVTGANKKIVWSSSNKKVATVTSKGKVKGINTGRCTITAKIGNKKYTCKVTVKQPVKIIKLNKKTVSITVGKTYTLKTTVSPKTANNKKVTWKSKNKKIATVSSKGVVKGIKAGSTTITATAKDGSGVKASCKVTILAKPKLLYLGADKTYFQVGTSDNATFTVKGKNLKNDVKLYNQNGKVVGQMKDDGKNGDKKKGDGIYTYVYKTKKTSAGMIAFYAKSGTIKTSTITLSYFNKPTTQNKQEVQQISEKVDEISKKYEAGGIIQSPVFVQKALDEVEEYAKELVASNEAIRYEKNNDNILIKLSSGLTVAYQPPISGVDSIGENVSMSIITMQPCLSGYSSDQAGNMRLPDNAARIIDSEFSNYDFSENLDDEQVNLDKIKSISSNQVIIWHGHGGYSKKNHSFLVTGEDFDWDKWFWDVSYWWDCVQDVMIENNGKVMITPKYIDKYCGNMNNSLIYLAACQSGKDNVLANSFLNKGAAAVVANSETILTVYNTRMENAILTNMTKVNLGTKNYYTLKEALAAAKVIYGEDDGEHGAKPMIFGGTSAENYRFGDVKPGNIVGKVCKASDRTTIISGATIKIFENGSVVKTVTSDSFGYYNVTLSPGTYQFEISASGYISFQSNITVESNKTHNMQTFLMVDGTETDNGIINGYIKNTSTGNGLYDVKLDIRKNWNNPSVGEIVKTIYTNSEGWYSVELEPGNYTITASKTGFVTNSFNAVAQKSNTSVQNGTIAPIVSSDAYQIVLSWGENPRDLDSHMVGMLSNGNIFHTYFSSKSVYEGNVEICHLDADDTSGYGPETITLRVNNTTPYYYYIYRYSGKGYLSTSEANIKVFQNGKLITTFNVPTNQGTGDYWNVFAILDGKLIPNNTITSSADTSYATINRTISAYTRNVLMRSFEGEMKRTEKE